MRTRTAKDARTRRFSALMVALLGLATAGCVGYATPGPKSQVGAATGAAAGGLLGAALGGETEGILAGVLLGGLIGGAVGNELDNADRTYADRIAYQSLESTPSGTRSDWHNPDSGNSGWIAPTRTYQTASGRYCREFEQNVYIGGRSESAYGTACRQPDGSWQVQ